MNNPVKITNTSEIDVITICECVSKEFEMAGENAMRRPVIEYGAALDIIHSSNTHVPDSVLWYSILSAIDSCKDFNQCEEIAYNFVTTVPPLKARQHASYCRQRDMIDAVARTDIPPDGPTHLIPIWTVGDGNCLLRALSRGFFNTDSRHLEISLPQ